MKIRRALVSVHDKTGVVDLARELARIGVEIVSTGGTAKLLRESGVAVRDVSEISDLHGDDGKLEAVTLTTGERLPFSFLFLFLGALPCTDWLDDVVARDDKGFVLTGSATDADYILETSVPGVFAAGDVRSGSAKRCATAVGEGSMAVQLVHAHLARTPAVQ